MSGLNTLAANAFREQKIIDFLAQLNGNDFSIVDTMLSDITNLAGIKAEFAAKALPAPSDQDIYNHLKKLNETIAQWEAAGYRYKNDENGLKLVDAMVRKPGQYLNYQALWSTAEAAIIGPKDAFYKVIYDALQSDALLGPTDFPDPADAALNGNDAAKIIAKRNYLIIALASIKNPADNKQLEPGVISTLDSGYPTGGNSPAWFAAQRLKLYRFSEVVAALDDNSKKTAISQLLHAGKHCSDAKLDMYQNLLALFNAPANLALENAEKALATNLQEKMEMIATKMKADLLQSQIDTFYTRVTGIPEQPILIYDNWGPEQVISVRAESITYKAGTWDFYAPRLGLKLRQTMYPNMRFILNENDFFKPGAYTPRKLFEKIRPGLGNEITQEYAGSLAPLITGGELGYRLIRGELIKRGFLENN